MPFKTDDITSPDDYCFIHGKFYQFKNLEKLKAFEDEKFTIYNITQFIYSDINQYIEDYVLPDVADNDKERYRQRALNIYNYFNGNSKNYFDYFYYEKSDTISTR